ncbi:MAG TPA: hydrogenase iron-sulfur subunit [Dehalococcoidales bacterium]|nr:hydrogenase iron-sulfur subunit [Dehalococcoidales bacterium]
MKVSSKVVAFVCNWEGYLGLESAAQKGLTLPSSVRIVRVSCLSRVQPGIMLKAFEKGAGGVILIGCSNHNCHYGSDQNTVDMSVRKVHDIMSLLGLNKDQLGLHRMDKVDQAGLTEVLLKFNNRVQTLVNS